MVAPRNQVIVTFNGGIPLVLAQRNDILVATLKSIPYFTSETTTIPIVHMQNSTNVCSVHNIIEDDVAFRLLATSLKGKSLQWYIGLQPNSIRNKDELGENLCE